MEPVPKSPESVSIWISVINVIGGAVMGVASAVWYVRGVRDDVRDLKEDVKDIKTVIFKERGGLAFLTEEEHTKICRASQDAFGKDLDLMAKDISHMKETLNRIEANSGVDELRHMREIMKGIAQQLESLHSRRPHS